MCPVNKDSLLVIGGYNGDYMKNFSTLSPSSMSASKKFPIEMGLGCYNAAKVVHNGKVYGRVLAYVETPDRKCYFVDLKMENRYLPEFDRPI